MIPGSPAYPQSLFDNIISATGISTGASILEIGCGTGQATLEFAKRGYRMTCLEALPDRAAEAARNLQPYPQVKIIPVYFEEWPLPQTHYDIVLSATAFHHIAPEQRYVKAAQALKKDGHLVCFWNWGDSVQERIVAFEIEMEQSGRFEKPVVKTYIREHLPATVLFMAKKHS